MTFPYIHSTFIVNNIIGIFHPADDECEEKSSNINVENNWWFLENYEGKLVYNPKKDKLHLVYQCIDDTQYECCEDTIGKVNLIDGTIQFDLIYVHSLICEIKKNENIIQTLKKRNDTDNQLMDIYHSACIENQSVICNLKKTIAEHMNNTNEFDANLLSLKYENANLKLEKEAIEKELICIKMMNEMLKQGNTQQKQTHIQIYRILFVGIMLAIVYMLYM
jgi:hypothetical protein